MKPEGQRFSSPRRDIILSDTSGLAFSQRDTKFFVPLLYIKSEFKFCGSGIDRYLFVDILEKKDKSADPTPRRMKPEGQSFSSFQESEASPPPP